MSEPRKVRPYFRVGQRVKMTQYGIDAGLARGLGKFRNKPMPTTGVVTAYDIRYPLRVQVRRDNRKMASWYHVTFWERAR
jgi:hypothetical protein